jgi:hypothetical protein
MRSYSAHMSNSPLSAEAAAGPQVDDLNSPLVVAVHEAYLKIGRTMVERSLTRANIVLTSATAATTAYTALLGLVYASAHGRRLPPIALLPVVYLGIAIALTAFYVGYLAPHRRRFHALPVGNTQAVAEERLATFLTWVSDSVLSRAWALRTALVSLGLGLVLLPVGFISFNHVLITLVETVPSVLLLVFVGIEIWRWCGSQVTEPQLAQMDLVAGPVMSLPDAPHTSDTLLPNDIFRPPLS